MFAKNILDIYYNSVPLKLISFYSVDELNELVRAREHKTYEGVVRNAIGPNDGRDSLFGR